MIHIEIMFNTKQNVYITMNQRGLLNSICFVSMEKFYNSSIRHTITKISSRPLAAYPKTE